jgi:hypothetical protein
MYNLLIKCYTKILVINMIQVHKTHSQGNLLSKLKPWAGALGIVALLGTAVAMDVKLNPIKRDNAAIHTLASPTATPAQKDAAVNTLLTSELPDSPKLAMSYLKADLELATARAVNALQRSE